MCIQIYHILTDPAIDNFKKSHRKGMAVAHLPRRPGIKEKYPVNPFMKRMMGMTEDDHIGPDPLQPLPQRLGRTLGVPHPVSHQDPFFRQAYHAEEGEGIGQENGVHIPPDGHDRRNLLQLYQQPIRLDITGMKDQINALEEIGNRFVEVVVGVR